MSAISRHNYVRLHFYSSLNLPARYIRAGLIFRYVVVKFQWLLAFVSTVQRICNAFHIIS